MTEFIGDPGGSEVLPDALCIQALTTVARPSVTLPNAFSPFAAKILNLNPARIAFGVELSNNITAPYYLTTDPNNTGIGLIQLDTQPIKVFTIQQLSVLCGYEWYFLSTGGATVNVWEISRPG